MVIGPKLTSLFFEKNYIQTLAFEEIDMVSGAGIVG
jgi:hypothetical protein